MTEENQEKIQKEKKARNPWMYTTIIFVIIAIALAAASFSNITGQLVAPTDTFGEDGGDIIPIDEIDELALDFFNTMLSETPGTLVEVNEVSGLYQVMISVQGQIVPLYFTKDGYWIYQGQDLISITELPDTQEPQQQQPSDIPKSDKPQVELFVMTHCPYGTQSEKAMIPAIKTLGDSVDFSVRFVHYFMHGEREEIETYRQVCIREEHPDIYLDYLACFLEDGDSEKCLSEYNLNIDSCMENNAEDYYAEDSALSQAYGVGGSPTLVINGVITSFTRSPAGALSIICSAFTEMPEECNVELSSTPASSGFGYAEGEDTQGQC